jgi:hypothetical protein
VRVLDHLAGEMRKHEEYVQREIFELKREVQIFENHKLINLAGDNNT